MRVLFFAPAFTRFRGGIEAMVAILTNHLTDQGHEVGIVTGGDAEQHPDPVFDIPASVPVFQLWVTDTPQSRETLRKVVTDFAPDVFVVRGASTVYFNMIDAVRGTNIRLVLSESYDPAASEKHFPSPVARLSAFAAADRIHFLVANFKDSLPDYLQDRVRPIGNPVEPNPHRAHPEGRPGERRFIINVARITFFQKAQDVLVRAFAQLADRYPGWDLRLVGDTFKSEDHKKLVDLIASLGLQDRVHILGSQPKPEVYRLLAESHIFAFPSLFEGFGIALVEGMASGLPCVGFADAPAVNSLIQHEENGLLVKRLGDPDTLASGLERLMASPEQRRTMGDNGVEFSKRFASDIIARRWEALISEAAAEPRAIMSTVPTDKDLLLGSLWYRLAQDHLLYDVPQRQRASQPASDVHTLEFRIGRKFLKIVNRLLPLQTRRRAAVKYAYRRARGIR